MGEETNPINYLKMLGYRFLRGFIAGAIGAMAPVVIIIKEWNDVISVLAALALVGLAGGITGGLLALDKYVRVEK